MHAGGERGIDVALGAVADHPTGVRLQLVAGDHLPVRGRVLFRNNLHSRKITGQAGARQLVGLLRLVTLGHQDQVMARRKLRKRFFDARQQFNFLFGNRTGKAAHLLACFFRHRRGAQALKAGNQRARKARQPVTVREDRFALNGVQCFAHLRRRVLVVIEKADEGSNGSLKVDVVFPKRVVRVDKQSLAGGELRHGFDVNGCAPPMKVPWSKAKWQSGFPLRPLVASPTLRLVSELPAMTGYCEIALPVPLDRTFTYALRLGQIVQRGMRVVVPFRNEKLIGVVTAVMVDPPADVEVKSLEAVLDDEPLLSEQLLALAEWMAGYYLAPLGEVLRGMLPLGAEVRRTVYYRITDLGRDVLANRLEAAEEEWHREARADEDSEVPKSKAGKRRGKLSLDEQNLEIRVLRRLAEGEPVKVSTLRTATAATLPILAGMLRKKWIARETSLWSVMREGPSALRCW